MSFADSSASTRLMPYFAVFRPGLTGVLGYGHQARRSLLVEASFNGVMICMVILILNHCDL